MYMKSVLTVLLAAAVPFAAAKSSSTQPTAKQIIGKWQCERGSGNDSSKLALELHPNGSLTNHLTVNIDVMGTTVSYELHSAGKWGLTKNTLSQHETFSEAKRLHDVAALNGVPKQVDEGIFADMQRMIKERRLHTAKRTVSKVQPDSMVLTDNGADYVCSRAK